MNKNYIILALTLLVTGLIIVSTNNIKLKIIIKKQCQIMTKQAQNSFLVKEALFHQVALYKNDNSINCLEALICERTSNTEPILIYRFPINMCQSCIDSDFGYLKEYCKLTGMNNILLLPSNEHYRDGQIRMKSLCSNYQYLAVEDSISPLPIDNNGISSRFFGILDIDGHIKEIFFPSLGNMVTGYYFQYIHDKYPQNR